MTTWKTVLQSEEGEECVHTSGDQLVGLDWNVLHVVSVLPSAVPRGSFRPGNTSDVFAMERRFRNIWDGCGVNGKGNLTLGSWHYRERTRARNSHRTGAGRYCLPSCFSSGPIATGSVGFTLRNVVKVFLRCICKYVGHTRVFVVELCY